MSEYNYGDSDDVEMFKSETPNRKSVEYQQLKNFDDTELESLTSFN